MSSTAVVAFVLLMHYYNDAQILSRLNPSVLALSLSFSTSIDPVFSSFCAFFFALFAYILFFLLLRFLFLLSAYTHTHIHDTPLVPFVLALLYSLLE